VHWYRIDTPGDYAFAANPKSYGTQGAAAGPDNGISFQVFEATNLSKAMVPFQGEVIEVPPVAHKCLESGEICTAVDTTPGYRSGRIKSVNFPLYVKVFASDPSKLRMDGKYVFYAKRMNCGSRNEACTMVPFEKMLEPADVSLPTVTDLTAVKSNELWYAFRVETSDTPDDYDESQTLHFFAAELASDPPYIADVAIFAENGDVPIAHVDFTTSTKTVTPRDKSKSPLQLRVWEYSDTFRGGRKLLAGKYYMRVLRRADATKGNVLAGWSTNLTWIYGPEFGGPQAAPCNIEVNDTQEVGEDEIYLALRGCDLGGCIKTLPSTYGPPDGAPEAKTMIEFDSHFNEHAEHQWPERFFPRLKNDAHPTGESFTTIPAFGTTRVITLELWEDDKSSDEMAMATFSCSSRPTCITSNMDITFDGDGDYRIGGCNLAHFLGAKGCQTNADCNAMLACTGGICVQP
jgi:hypothetical protein